MSVPNRVLDGTMAYGTVIITVGAATFIMNNFSVTRTETTVQDTDQNGKPQRQRMTEGVATFSAELQLATSTTTRPQFGNTFVVNVDSNYGAETFIFDPVDYSSDNGPGNIRVIPAKGRKAINPGQISTAN